MELESGDNRLVLAKSEQAHYALGLLSVEHDLDTLEIDDDGEEVGDGRGQEGEGTGVRTGPGVVWDN
jgi:hypothetical protein